MNTTNDKNEFIRKKFLEHLGEVISRKRRRVNLSQEELGKLLGVSDSTITRYEKGQIEIPSSSLPLISMHCRFPMRDYLVNRDEISVEKVLKDALDYEKPVRVDYITGTHTQIVKEEAPDYEGNIIAKEMSVLCTEEESNIIIEMGIYADSLGNNDTEVFYKRRISRFILYSYMMNKQDEEQKKRLITLYEKYTQQKFPPNLY